MKSSTRTRCTREVTSTIVVWGMQYVVHTCDSDTGVAGGRLVLPQYAEYGRKAGIRHLQDNLLTRIKSFQLHTMMRAGPYTG